MEEDLIIVVSVFSVAWLVTFVMAAVLFVQVNELKKKVTELQSAGRMRIQKLKMEADKEHAFHNPALAPHEELSRRGYSMYVGPEESGGDAESARPPERQTGGQLFVEDLARELESRQQRQSQQNPTTQHTPPFLLQSIQENKQKNRNLMNPAANGRQSDTNPNFIY